MVTIIFAVANEALPGRNGKVVNKGSVDEWQEK
jgi:hypothetical protein